ncbi:hypothetical protein QQF64_031606 [Cirrhinus molitorella]|uniref:Uncharacterized protein n=1 Tax=Cirrhinus molitorella TaxID=172907 RepID=A0ABR3MXG6_9TELE
MYRTNFKMNSGDRSGDFVTTHSDFKSLPVSRAKLVRPITKVRIGVPEGKYPESTYRSNYTKHEVSPKLPAKESGSAGVGSSLRQEKKNRYGSSYEEQFLYSWCPPLPPLESIEKARQCWQRVQYSAVPMGDRKNIRDKQTTYSSSFGQSGDHSPESLLCKRKKPQPFKLRELCNDEWITVSSEEFPSHKCSPVYLERRCPTLSSVLIGETLKGNQERPLTTNQFFFSEFPVYVDGSSIRTFSNVIFGRPDLAGKYYSTTSQEQFASKEVLRPKTSVYPSSHMLFEQEPDRMITTMQKDFVPLNCRRQKLSPSQLQQVKDSHIRPRHSKHDFRTTHNETSLILDRLMFTAQVSHCCGNRRASVWG